MSRNAIAELQGINARTPAKTAMSSSVEYPQ